MITALTDVWDSIARLGAGLDETQWHLLTDCPGWTVKDNVAHIIGIESVILGRPEPEVTLPPDLPHVKNELGRSNEIWVESFRSLTGAQVLEAFRAVTALRLGQIQAFTEADWAADSWTPVGLGTVRDLMPFRVLDSWVHELDMRRAVGRPADMESPSAQVALGRLRGVLGAVVGARARVEEGKRVAFAVEGPGGFVSVIAVRDGRASETEGGAPADVELHMDADTFVRLIGGRGERGAVEAAVAVQGDAALGERVLDHMKVLM